MALFNIQRWVCSHANLTCSKKILVSMVITNEIAFCHKGETLGLIARIESTPIDWNDKVQLTTNLLYWFILCLSH